MSARTILILFCLLAGTMTANSQVSVKEMTDNPWPFEVTPTNILNHYGSFLKEGKYTRKNKSELSGKDTIIRYHRGKSTIFFYKPVHSHPVFLGATLYDARIQIRGGISAGLTRQELLAKISWPDDNSDTIRISLPGGTYNTSVILRNNKIKVIRIEARNKNHRV